MLLRNNHLNDCESDYNQKDAEGFINLYGLPIKVQAMVDEQNKK